MKHAESLAYDWWKNPPDTLGKPNNYLLSQEELVQYRDILKRLHDACLAEAANVSKLVRAYETKKVPSFVEPPKPVSIASALEFMVYTGKEKLALTELLVGCTRQRIKKNEAEQAQLRG